MFSPMLMRQGTGVKVFHVRHKLQAKTLRRKGGNRESSGGKAIYREKEKKHWGFYTLDSWKKE